MKSCRTDWFQTAPSINISVFAKTSVPDHSYVEVNRVKCKMYLVFEGGKSIFEQTLVLKNVSVIDFILFKTFWTITKLTSTS